MRTRQLINNLLKDINLDNAEGWDPVGFSIPLAGKKILKNVLVCLDITEEVVNEAISKDCNLIISHHPFIFNSKDVDFKLYPYKKALFDKLKDHKINTFSFHTAFDKTNHFSARGIASLLALKDNIHTIKDNDFALKIDYSGTIISLINLIKNKADINHIQTNISTEKLNSKIKNFIVFPGSGFSGDIVKIAPKTDLIITSDAKWSDLVTYSESKISILNVSHNLEKGFIYSMIELLNKHLSKNQIFYIFQKDLLKNI